MPLTLNWKDTLFPEILETISKSAHRAMRGERGSERTSMCDSSQADIVEMSWPFCCYCWKLLLSLDFRLRRRCWWWRQLRHEKWWMITVESMFGPKKWTSAFTRETTRRWLIFFVLRCCFTTGSLTVFFPLLSRWTDCIPLVFVCFNSGNGNESRVSTTKEGEQRYKSTHPTEKK